MYSIIVLSTLNTAVSQSKPLGTWNIVNVKLNLNEHLGLWSEDQLRSIRFFDEFFYYEIKGGVTYSMKDHVSITCGFGHYATYTPGGNFEQPIVTKETRTWLQLLMEQKWNRIYFEHRYRVEQRYLNTGYQNRFRYRLNANIPINHNEVISKTIYAYIGDEVFFTDKAPFYERNRFFTGLGYKATSIFTIQSGYMRQYDYNLTSETSRDFLQIAVLLNLHPEDFHKHSVPAISD